MASSRKKAPAAAPAAAAAAEPAPRKRHDALSRKTAAKIEKLAESVLRTVGKGKNPFLEIPVRSLANVSWSEKKRLVELGDQKQRRYFFNVSMARKFMQTFLVSEACKELIDAAKTTSIRDLYYMTKHTIGDTRQNTFEEQDESDPIIEDLEVTLDSLREELHLFAARKGSMVGPITITDSGDTIDLRRMGSGGWAVPSIVEANVIGFRRHEAKYVLLIEKDAVWARFNEDKFWKRNSCIIVQGGGQPPRGVRRLVQRLHSELGLPVYVLVDNDPWGFYIYSVMKQGSINLAYESMRMAVPEARFVGLSSFDKEQFALPPNVAIKMDDSDNNRAKQMLGYPWFKAARWQREIQEMVRSGLKFELEALSRRGISFITEEYVPKKLRDRDWLE
jgi:DNA topoisomerase-6 subunit A